VLEGVSCRDVGIRLPKFSGWVCKEFARCFVGHLLYGTWANKRHDASKASSLHNTQADAIRAGNEMLENQGGGELIVKGLDGRIRSKDTIVPGNDPLPPRDTEN